MRKKVSSAPAGLLLPTATTPARRRLRRVIRGWAAAGLLGAGSVLYALNSPVRAYAQAAIQATAELPTPTPRAFTSRSGQFRVPALSPPAPPPRLLSLETNQNFIQLDPTLLPVSCDRIKESLCRQLGAGTAWRGRVYLRLYSINSAEDLITITSERFRDGWQYSVELPSLIERGRYVHAIVQVLLLEMANRDGGERSAELPEWLAEGFSRQLLASTNSELELILPPPQVIAGGMRVTSTFVSARREDPLEEAHKRLSAGSPLTFQELSWPTPEQLSGEGEAVYGSSAQLFVSELLKLPDGPACLRAMLADLPRRYNWQLSFLLAFNSSFQRPLDVEKWWALRVVHFTGRELSQAWTPDESWRKLDELVRSEVRVHVGTNELPLQAEVKLQTIIREWDASRQTQALQEKIRQLDALRLRLAPEVAPLTAQYRQVLANYLKTRDQGGSFFGLGRKAAQRRAAQEVLQQLDSLDAQRASQRPPSKPAATVQSEFIPRA